jgi:hypothetical protein
MWVGHRRGSKLITSYWRANSSICCSPRSWPNTPSMPTPGPPGMNRSTPFLRAGSAAVTRPGQSVNCTPPGTPPEGLLETTQSVLAEACDERVRSCARGPRSSEPPDSLQCLQRTASQQTGVRPEMVSRRWGGSPTREPPLCEAPAVVGRRFASDLAKGRGKRACLAKTDIESNFRHRPLALSQQGLGTLNSLAGQRRDQPKILHARRRHFRMNARRRSRRLGAAIFTMGR